MGLSLFDLARFFLPSFTSLIKTCMYMYIIICIYCMKPPTCNIKAPKCTLFSRVKGHKRSPVLPRLIASIVGVNLLWRAHFESLRVAEAKTRLQLMSKRRSVLYFPYSPLFSRVKGHKGSPVLPWLLPSIMMGSLLRRAHFESLRAAEAKNAATINQLKYCSRSCITGNIALGVWSRGIFPVMHSHGTLTSM